MTTPRYQQLADDLSHCIRSGVLKPGDQVPSVRQLCALHDASPATVTHALHILEDRGLIEARPRQGFFVRTQSFAYPSQCALPGRPKAIELEGHRKLVMEFAQTCGNHFLGMSAIDDSLFPTKALKKLLVQQLHRNDNIVNDASYTGDIALREQIARRSLLLDCDFLPDEIVLTHGATEALDLCLRLLTKPGDIVAIAAPGPLRTLEMLEGQGLQALEIPSHPCDGLSVDALEFALRHHKVAALVVNANFPSPTGSLMPDKEKARLAELTGRHGVPVIEIDIFGELTHGPQRPKPVKAFDRHDNVLYCGDYRYVISPGFSVGYIAAGRHRLTLQACRKVHGEPVAALIQQTLASFMASGQYEPHLRRLRSQLASQMAAYRAAVFRYFPKGTRVACASGGMLLWLELPEGTDMTELQRRSHCEGYVFAPGALFSQGESFNNCLRINTGHPMTVELEQGVRVIGELAHAVQAEAAVLA
ncbi:PLP-dependent aminotransferase family protein [Chitinimonas sp.]|uniref:aminotransferase-like domain-containing protein n=1 Tax=Chitinimonas sp. TaxID=1934313 RepID=UPI002F928DF7